MIEGAKRITHHCVNVFILYIGGESIVLRKRSSRQCLSVVAGSCRSVRLGLSGVVGKIEAIAEL